MEGAAAASPRREEEAPADVAPARQICVAFRPVLDPFS